MTGVKYSEERVEIISVKEGSNNIISCVVRSELIATTSLPGQFVTVQVNNRGAGCIPVLRRPFAISNVKKDRFEFIFDVVGRGTELLKKVLKEEKCLNILGPLGNGFDLKSEKKQKLLIAGGIGIAPVKRLVQYFSTTDCRTTLIWGNRNKSGFFDTDYFIDQNIKLLICTDDGSMGFEGNVVDLLESEIKNKNLNSMSDYDIFVVGPDPMMKAVCVSVGKRNTVCQVSLETPMACGMGVCQGCAVKKKNEEGYYLVCKDGPVFYSDKIIMN
ncbi:TPA: dihydroorotate dehydrogenase electron transfer subunit [Candidatus Delongbacteria bacterium]|nr:MAG: hypothetical protein A2Y39_05940 [Candidatus Delongbacteria bacterium GWF2_40_14]HAQ60995.1 dihydroorotate dehydrogenase electron transfer subunit [Candidatus Delongbacteria bacterium]